MLSCLTEVHAMSFSTKVHALSCSIEKCIESFLQLEDYYIIHYKDTVIERPLQLVCHRRISNGLHIMNMHYLALTHFISDSSQQSIKLLLREMMNCVAWKSFVLKIFNTEHIPRANQALGWASIYAKLNLEVIWFDYILSWALRYTQLSSRCLTSCSFPTTAKML